MSKWTSRKWIITLLTAGGGALTGLVGHLTVDEKMFYAGIGTAVAAVLGYLKSEKDVDAARAGAPVVYDYDKEYPCDCPSCQPNKE